MDGFQEWLKSGHILCDLMNSLAPGSVRKVNNTEKVKMAVSRDHCTYRYQNLHLLITHFQALRMNKEYENISFFLSACSDYGIDKNDLFQVSFKKPKINLEKLELECYRRHTVTRII